MAEDRFLHLQPGTVVNGRYEIVKCLGTGSMGMVYACRHKELAGHLVAMKVLFGEVARDEVAAARFRNEIVASYGVSHPNVVRAYEYFRDGDLIAFTMEYIGGGDLADRLAGDEPIEIDETVRMLSQMCSGMQAVHDAGIIHRDIKPENILLTSQNDIKITDFGIARTGAGPKLTEHGGVVGTLDYVSPEYLEKGQVDVRSDIYALGVLAYEMITGEAPFKGNSVIETMTMRLRTDPVPPKQLREDCPVQLSTIVLTMMARDPEKRYQSAGDIYRDLIAFSTGSLPKHSANRSDTAKLSGRGARGGTYTGPSITNPPDNLSASGSLSVSQSGRMLAGTVMLEPKAVDSIKRSIIHKDDDLDDEMYDSANFRVPQLESVIGRPGRSGSGYYAPKYHDSGVSAAQRSVAVSQSHLSQDRVKALFHDSYATGGGTTFGTILLWVLIVAIGFGIGLYVMRNYHPELFGEVGQSSGVSYREGR